MHEAELGILRILDGLVNQESVKPVLDEAVARVEHKLIQDRDAVMAWETVPLSAYGEGVPDGIRSSWVFVLRAGATTGAERHPNSHQRMTSCRGSGDFQIRPDEEWCSYHLVSDPNQPPENRWLSIPPNTWHQGVVPDANWALVSFQTVPEDELIEERPDPTNPGLTEQRFYVERNTKDLRP